MLENEGGGVMRVQNRDQWGEQHRIQRDNPAGSEDQSGADIVMS